jgi:hypothetical protein
MNKQPEPQKPEWFELLDGDAPSAQVTKINKKLPLIAAVVAGAVIASGAIFAGASEEQTIAPQSSSVAINQVDNSTSTPATNSPSVATTNPSAPSATIAPAGGVQAPGAANGDDEDGEHEGREGRRGDGEREDHERDGDRDRDEH